jgi:hypothetical protein
MQPDALGPLFWLEVAANCIGNLLPGNDFR